jgi:hypothetical protein
VGLLSTAGFNRFANRAASDDFFLFRKPTQEPSPVSDVTFGQLIGLLLAIFMVGLGLTLGYFLAMQKYVDLVPSHVRYAGKMIRFSFYLNMALVVVLALLSMMSGNAVGAVFAAIYLLIMMMMFASMLNF